MVQPKNPNTNCCNQSVCYCPTLIEALDMGNSEYMPPPDVPQEGTIPEFGNAAYTQGNKPRPPCSVCDYLLLKITLLKSQYCRSRALNMAGQQSAPKEEDKEN